MWSVATTITVVLPGGTERGVPGCPVFELLPKPHLPHAILPAQRRWTTDVTAGVAGSTGVARTAPSAPPPGRTRGETASNEDHSAHNNVVWPQRREVVALGTALHHLSSVTHGSGSGWHHLLKIRIPWGLRAGCCLSSVRTATHVCFCIGPRPDRTDGDDPGPGESRGDVANAYSGCE